MLEFVVDNPEINNIICYEDNYILLNNKKIISTEKDKKINMILIDLKNYTPNQKNINKLSMLSNIVAIGTVDTFEIVSSKYSYPHVGDTIKILSIQ